MNFGCRHADAMGCCWPKPPVLTRKLLPSRQVAVGILATDATILLSAIGLAFAGPRSEQAALRLARRQQERVLGYGIALPRCSARAALQHRSVHAPGDRSGHERARW